MNNSPTDQDHLNAVTAATSAFDAARAEFVAALQAAVNAGVSAEKVGGACGMTRQRVWQIVQRGRVR